MAGAIAGTAILDCSLSNTLHTVTITINNSCNLQCPHCYLQYDSDANLIDDKILSILYNGTYNHLAIVGKEPLVDPRSIQMCEEIIIGATSRSKTVSLITNGLNLSFLKSHLLGLLSYIDISFDGGPETYQKYRKGSLRKLVQGLAHLNNNNFGNINALNVLNNNTITAIDDMMRITELADFRKIMFSPYIITSNQGDNYVKALPIEDIFQALSDSHLFMEESRAFLLLDPFHLQTEQERDNISALIANYGLEKKTKLISNDPLLYGIIRITFDGILLTPYQSIHTRDYKSAGMDLTKYNSNSISLEEMYSNLLEQHAYV